MSFHWINSKYIALALGYNLSIRKKRLSQKLLLTRIPSKNQRLRGSGGRIVSILFESSLYEVFLKLLTCTILPLSSIKYTFSGEMEELQYATVSVSLFPNAPHTACKNR